MWHVTQNMNHVVDTKMQHKNFLIIWIIFTALFIFGFGKDAKAQYDCDGTACSCEEYCSYFGLDAAQCTCTANTDTGYDTSGTAAAGSVCTQAANWYSMDSCAIGSTCNADGICETSWIGSIGDTLGIGQGTTDGTSTSTSGLPLGVGGGYTNTGDVYTQSGGYTSTSGGTYSMGTAAVCQGQIIGGVCFPAQTGLPDPQGGISQILANLFSWIMGIFTTLAIIAFVVSGIQYLTAAGSEDQLETAKRNATWSFVGVLVGLSGFVIIRAVAGFLSGTGLF